MKKWVRILIGFLIFIFLSGTVLGYALYQIVLANNVTLENDQKGYLYIRTGSDFQQLMETVEKSGLIKNIRTFRIVALQKNLPAHVRPGRYEITAGMSNNTLVNMLRGGKQKPLKVTFNSVTFPSQLAGIISKQIEADSLSIISRFQDAGFLAGFGFTPETAPVMCIPNTYEFYWNTSADGFFRRMHKEYKAFWTPERLLKAELINLTPVEVSILASIVEKETSRNDEKARIAGVYLNRLKRQWNLQADPTVVYANYLMTGRMLNRVLWVHTQIDSPYNTYLYGGLPPGPICFPSIQSIDAVLNPEKHDYLFFVASSDFSGYHRFSTNYAQHIKYANEYREALRKQKSAGSNNSMP